MKAAISFLRQSDISYREQYPVKPHTAYKVGGNAELATFPASIVELQTVIGWCRSMHSPFFLIGGGANVIVSDEGLPGITIFTENLSQLKLQNGKILAECGVSMKNLAHFAASHGISGFEFLYDIPGSVGGALIMNAGNNDGEMKNITCIVQSLTRETHVVSLAGNQCSFGYRTSRFKEERMVVLSAAFDATTRKPEQKIYEKMDRIKGERHRKFPNKYPNGGSVFKRPPGDYAGRLIEASGCGGMQVGDAQVSTKHRGFIVNLGNATASDIRGLILLVQKKVKETQGVVLEREQIFLPEDMD